MVRTFHMKVKQSNFERSVLAEFRNVGKFIKYTTDGTKTSYYTNGRYLGYYEQDSMDSIGYGYIYNEIYRTFKKRSIEELSEEPDFFKPKIDNESNNKVSYCPKCDYLTVVSTDNAWVRCDDCKYLYEQ